MTENQGKLCGSSRGDLCSAFQPNTLPLNNFSEHRMMVFNHEVVPNALRTKYEPQVEHEEQRLALEVSSMSTDQAESAVSSLNELVTSVLDLVSRVSISLEYY